MTEHTTIQITTAQADELQSRKTHDDESYKSVIARLLADEDAQDTDATWTADDVERVRSMLKTVESRTGRIERTLEDVQR